ncbi:hypothetical protein QR97_18570 [Streptomyces sp. PBH53]|nr:hypothetical protein QR97_18570 [Streptomyces sp. PBH53]
MGQVDQPAPRKLRVEYRLLDVRGGAETDDQAVGAGTEGQVHIDAYQVSQGALVIRHRARPVVRLLEQLLRRASDVEARQILQERVHVRCFARGAVHRVLAQ